MTAADTKPGRIPLSSRTGRFVMITTILGSSVALLTSTVVNVALPALARELNAGTAGQQWVVNAYLLTIASLILIGGSLGDRFGRVKIYQIGVIWFALASLASALAPSIEVLIGARLLQGIGGALLTPGSLSIIEATLRPDDRGRGVGQWSGFTGIAAAIGPLVGGFLVEFSWRWVFVINIPIALLVLYLTRRVPETSDDSAASTKLDVWGATLTVVALAGVSYAVIEVPGSGLGPLSLVAIGAALISGTWLVVYERRVEAPMVPISLFVSRPFAAANAITVLVYGGMGIVFFLLAIHLQVTVGWSPLAAGAAMLPVTVLMLILSPYIGGLTQRIGPRWPLSVGPLLIAAGMLLHTRIGPDATYVADVLPGLVVFGIGLGISVAPVTTTALGTVPNSRSGAASGANNAMARTGQLLAVSAIPPLVGLTDQALNRAEDLNAGFGPAMVVAAILAASGALISVVFLRSDDLSKVESR